MNNPLQATAPDRHASVHASAGTGKTWLLVTRMLRLLLAGAAPENILAVTFTRKAAAEMLQRLNERLAQLASGSDEEVDASLRAMGETPADALRERARRLYENLLFAPHALRATTFHAFCQEILQRFPVEAEVPPGIRTAGGRIRIDRRGLGCAVCRGHVETRWQNRTRPGNAVRRLQRPWQHPSGPEQFSTTAHRLVGLYRRSYGYLGPCRGA